MQQFNPIDAALLFLEKPHTPFHVSMINIYDPSTCSKGPPTFEDIVDAVRGSLPGAPPFRRKIVRAPLDLDYPYWVEDEDFDLELHVHHIALPAPGDWNQFRSLGSRIVSRPLDLSRPPWELTVIDGLDNIEGLPPGCFATVMKVHHCAIDGQAGVALFSLLHQESPDKLPPVLGDNWQGEPVPGRAKLWQKAWINSIKRPARIFRLMASNATGLVKAALNEIRSDDDDGITEVPRTILNGPVSSRRIFDDVRCSLEDLKKVRKQVEGSTINDVCLAIVAETMRQYLKSKGELPDDPLVCHLPIATRTPEQAKAGGNQISMMRVSLHTDIADPVSRLEAITEETQKKKAVQDGVVMKTILDVTYNLPGALVGMAARVAPLVIAHSTLFSNTMLSNVPGARDPLYFLGAKHVHSTGCSPLMDGGGILHAVTSFHGELLFSYTACRGLLPDDDFYSDCLRQAIATVINATKGKRAAAKSDRPVSAKSSKPEKRSKAERQQKPS